MSCALHPARGGKHLVIDLGGLSLRRHDQAGGKQSPGDLDPREERAAMIAAQIENDHLHAIGLERVDGVVQLARSRGGEVADPNIADFLRHERPGAVHRGDSQRDAHDDRFAIAHRAELELMEAIRIGMPQGFRRAGQTGAVHRPAVDPRDPVAALELRIAEFRPRVRHDSFDHQSALHPAQIQPRAGQVRDRSDLPADGGGEENRVFIQSTACAACAAR